MYNDIQLTTVDNLKEVTSISKNIQTDLLEPYIAVSEEFYAYPILGDALLTELKNQITGGTVSQLNQTLLNQFIIPLVAYGSWFEYIPFNTTKSTQAGEVRQGGNPASMDEVAIKRNSLKEKVTYYQNKLIKYLDDNKASYPLYRSTTNDTNSNNNSSNNFSIYLGDYN